jgi:ribosomal protein L37AE/L43A
MKFATFTPLQEQVYELGVCARCHKKTMRFVHAGAGMAFWQCTGCKVVAVLEDGNDL